MDLELRAMLSVSRRMPRFPHATAIGNRVLKPLYLRKPRSQARVDVLGFQMLLDPTETVDANLLFHPQLYDPDEVDFLRSRLRDGDVVVDIGANVGFYALVAATLVGDEGRVLAIEADPYCFRRLSDNIELNEFTNVQACNVGVSDRQETLRLTLQTSGNRGGNSFLVKGDDGIDVRCEPLMSILTSQGIDRVAVAKLDIEGFECRVLRAFLETAPRTLLPRFVIVEFYEALADQTCGNPVALLCSNGYVLLGKWGGNHILELS